MMKYDRPKLAALSSMNVEGGGPKCDTGSGASGDCTIGTLPGGSSGNGDAPGSGGCSHGAIATSCVTGPTAG